MTPETQTPVERVSDLDGLEGLARAIDAASANLFDVKSRTVPGWQKNSTAYNDAVGALAGARNAFNAAANPATVLSLITRLRAAEAATAAAVEREPTMFWDADDWENGGTDAADVVGIYAPGEVVKLDTAISGPTRWGVMNDQHEVRVFPAPEEAEAWFAALPSTPVAENV